MKYITIIALFLFIGCATGTQSQKEIEAYYVGDIDGIHQFQKFESDQMIQIESVKIPLRENMIYFIGIENSDPVYIYFLYAGSQKGHMLK